MVNNRALELKRDFKQINVSVNDTNKLEDKKINKKGTFSNNTWNNWYDLLNNCISRSIKNRWCC